MFVNKSQKTTTSCSFRYKKNKKWCYVEVLVDWRVQEVDEAAIIPHIAEASGHKYPYEVLFRNLHKLLMDTATSE